MDESPGHSYEPAQIAPVICSMPRLTQTQENNYIWTLDSLISASAQAYTRFMIKTSKWSPRMQVFKLRKSFGLHCVGHPAFLYYIGAQKVIIKTCHQPVTILNSQRFRDGVVTKACIATWLMTLQGRDVEDMPNIINPHLETG